MSRPPGTTSPATRTPAPPAAPGATARRRLATIGALVVAAVAVATGPASAHTEVQAQNARALAENVTLDFHAASESDASGITKLEVILPEGLTPADIRFDEGPKGWTYATTSRGYTVSGPELAVGADAEFSVTVRQLPDAEQLVFKTLQSYADGQIDRWIELEDTGEDGDGHGHPAPTLKLAPAAPGATPIAPTPSPTPTPTEAPAASPSPSTSASTEQTAADATADDGDGGLSTGAVAGIAAAVLVVLGAGAWWLRRRGSGA
ncbi:DUF1775 domain-containing protein [Streptomyces sp. NPDC048290]|uniref:DUF1775 domain-containing protein n=1 Tax=Streptomyces sp. NPDC048290 TaxID=3155811 RepID=UPI0034397854